MPGKDEFDIRVKLLLYQMIAETSVIPDSREVAASLSVPVGEVEEAFQRLHKMRLLVPEPGDPSRIRMAPPFSGIETSFRVVIESKTHYANCVWDALGIAAALHQNATVEASDGHTGESLMIHVGQSGAKETTYVAHFAVPAALWWKDIIFT